MKKTFLLAIVAFVFASFASAQTYSDLIISEYFEGTSNNKALEIYNGTGADVDLSQYSWKKETNGGGGYKDMTGSAMTGTLAAGKTFVIVNPQAEAKMKELANLVDGGSNGVTGFNGDDAIALYKNGEVIDMIGILGGGKDNKWGENVDMRRICEKGPNTTYVEAEWEKFTDLSDYSALGSHCGADDKAPVVKSMMALSKTSVKVVFNEKVTKESAETVANYSIDKSISISAAVLDAEAKEVELTISEIKNGEFYRVTVSKIADLAGNVMAAAVTDSIIYGSTEENTCATIAELRAKTVDKTTIYTLTGPVEVIALGTQRNQKWIADATGGIMIDDPDNMISGTYAIGDNMSMIQGVLVDYFGLLEFTPTNDAIKEATATVKAEAKPVTIAQIKAGGAEIEALESALVKISKVKFSDVAKFANGKNYRLNDGTNNDSVLRTHIYNVDYIGKDIPAGMKNITGIIVYSYEKYYIVPRNFVDIADFVSNETIAPVSFEVYPNPTSDFVELKLNEGGVYTVSITNIAGVKMNEFRGISGNMSIDLSSYRKGVYLINVAGESKSSTVKVVRK